MTPTKFVHITAVRVVKRGWLDKPFVLEAQFSNMDAAQWNTVNAFETETVATTAAKALIAGDQVVTVLKPEPVTPDSPAGAPDA